MDLSDVCVLVLFACAALWAARAKEIADSGYWGSVGQTARGLVWYVLDFERALMVAWVEERRAARKARQQVKVWG